MSQWQNLKLAIEQKRPVRARYKGGGLREFSPYLLGYKGETQHCLAWQYSGDSKSDGRIHRSSAEWRCFAVAELSQIELLDTPWVRGDRGTMQESCIDDTRVHVRDF